MIGKTKEHERAVTLRKQGASYSDIIKDVPVAKSTLSLWLRNINLAERQKQHLSEKRSEAAARGAQKRKTQRIVLSEKIRDTAIKEIGFVDKKSVRLIGAALYWAEGNKQKNNNVSSGVKFSNSDPEMIKFFYQWLLEICGILPENITFELYIHETGDIVLAQNFWANIMGLSKSNFSTVRLKSNKISYRKNRNKDYHGLIRINVRKSTNLNRKIMGWVSGFCRSFIR
ncbi:MAG: hypothetical protein PHD72_00430 [Patescibacteria group bacterium]|nr:hypothetical protein [Patescibacteria group bacterium]